MVSTALRRDNCRTLDVHFSARSFEDRTQFIKRMTGILPTNRDLLAELKEPRSGISDLPALGREKY
jgi:hypothetical protein